MKLRGNMSAWAAVTEGLAGAEHPLPTWLPHKELTARSLAGRLQETSVLPHTPLPWAALVSFSLSLRVSDVGEEPEGSTRPFMTYYRKGHRVVSAISHSLEARH